MPVWHAKTAPLEQQGQLRVLGIVQEQHPDRAQLFMQWQQMEWPLLVDAFNLLDVSVVPITLLIDEAGIVRKVGASLDDLDAFLATKELPPAIHPRLKLVVPNAIRSIWSQGPTRELLELLSKQAANSQDGGRARFRLGVAQRMMFDSPLSQPDDFARAVTNWQTALASNPNQYIWRRRIQQYGPRLDKPYPFYDWVDTAQREIVARGGEPVKLRTPLSGAELATPQRDFSAAPQTSSNDRVMPDTNFSVTITPIVVSATKTAESRTAHVHLVLKPAADTKWNAEAGPTMFVPASGASARYGPTKVTHHNQLQIIEFEAQSTHPDDRPANCAGAVYYHVCTGAEQQCFYLRQEVEFPLFPKY